MMKKKEMGFETVKCEEKPCSCDKCNDNNSNKNNDGKINIPEHVVNEIESNIEAKHEFEYQMTRLENYEKKETILKWIISILIILNNIIIIYKYL